MIGRTILPAQMAHDACALMSEPQRLAFAIGLVRDANEARSVLQLRRMEDLARATRQELERAAQIAEALA